MSKQPKRIYLLYDGRANFGSTDDATVYETCDSLAEALHQLKEWPADTVIISYDNTGPVLSDGRREN